MKTRSAIALTFVLFFLLNVASYAQQGGQFRVLVFSKTTGFRHQSIPKWSDGLEKNE